MLFTLLLEVWILCSSRSETDVQMDLVAPPSGPISLALPYLGHSPRELKPLFIITLSLSALTETRRTSSHTEAHQGFTSIVPNLSHLVQLSFLIRYVFPISYTRDDPRSPTG